MKKHYIECMQQCTTRCTRYELTNSNTYIFTTVCILRLCTYAMGTIYNAGILFHAYSRPRLTILTPDKLFLRPAISDNVEEFSEESEASGAVTVLFRLGRPKIIPWRLRPLRTLEAASAISCSRWVERFGRVSGIMIKNSPLWLTRDDAVVDTSAAAALQRREHECPGPDLLHVRWGSDVARLLGTSLSSRGALTSVGLVEHTATILDRLDNNSQWAIATNIHTCTFKVTVFISVEAMVRRKETQNIVNC